MNRVLAVPALALLSAALVACGGSSTSDATDATAEPGAGPWAVSDCATIAPPTTDAGVPAGASVQGEVATTTEVSVAPTVAVLEGAVPMTSLVISDVVSGEGAEVGAGATVTVEYCGVGLASGAIFDSSWARGQSATFPLAGVIQGWQEGIPGMKPGGRRLLVIPADLAYGEQPPPGSGIAPGESLVFVVDLVSSP